MRGPAAEPLPRAPRRGRHRRRRRWRKVLLVVGLVLFVLLGSGFGYVEYLNHQIDRVAVGDLSAAAANGTENILMVGSTTRCGLAHQNPAFGLCSQGVTGVNSDVVLLLHLDPNKGTAAILSIPRDLFIPNARTTGANKIDAALYQGPTQLVTAIQEDFGIPVHHYVVLNFDSFQGVVDALGGVKMYFPMPLYDAYSSLDIPTAGCRELNGFQALAVVRARHLQYRPPGVTTSSHYRWPYDPESDLSRIRRNHEFLRVLATQVSKRGLGNPFTDRSLVAAVLASGLQVDQHLSLTDIIGLVLTFHSANPSSAPQWTMPVLVHNGLDYYYRGYDYGSIELTSEPQDRQIIHQFLGTGANQSTLTGKALPAPGSFTVSVVNGSGVADQATTTADGLRALGFDATAEGNAPSSASPSETVVYYPANNSAAQARAEAVANELSGAVVMAMGPTTGGTDVTVVTGSDFSVSTPPSPTPVAPAVSTVAPTRTTTTTSTSSLAPPTAATQPLAPFDPRSCTASGGEGP